MNSQIDEGLTGFTNGNRLIQDGQRYAGAAVVSNTKNTWAEPHLAGMSVQEGELAALKMSFELKKDIKVIRATSCTVWPLPVMLQLLPLTTRTLPWSVTVIVTSSY